MSNESEAKLNLGCAAAQPYLDLVGSELPLRPFRLNPMKRREFLTTVTSAASVAAIAPLRAMAQTQSTEAASSGGAVVIDPKPLFDISPYLYMQFMEPLGVTDSSVEAAWDYDRDDWREDFINA